MTAEQTIIGRRIDGKAIVAQIDYDMDVDWDTGAPLPHGNHMVKVRFADGSESWESEAEIIWGTETNE